MTEPTEEAGDAEVSERPAKKQKTSQKAPPALSNIIKLVTSPNQQYAVAVTEDKCVRVFSIGVEGNLTELSQRIMPKRPCAIEVLPDNETIICGDKFGDVYSLPLLPSNKTDTGEAEGPEPTPAPEQAFKPAATTLTVHSQRNRRALEMQTKQKLFQTKKEPLAFEHKLLLGHVSMLTDVCHASRKVDGKTRNYIITADRDEHIRVSRGIPQAHIIEGYCLGHKEFVSKLCLIPGTDLLVSGGGDEWLGVWDWPSFTRKATINVHERFASSSKASLPDKDSKLAVSGLWTVPIGDSGESALVIASENVPALCILACSSLTEAQPKATLLDLDVLENSPLDVAATQNRLVVAVDSRDAEHKRHLAFELKYDVSGAIGASRDSPLEDRLHALNELGGVEEDGKTIDGLLYNIGNLRKRTGWGEDQEQE